MPGWWPESINSQEILKNTKDVLGDIKNPKVKEIVTKTLEQESWKIDATTQAAFDAKIRTMRTTKNYNDIATPENALLLKTFAILHYGVNADAVWGINGSFWRESLAILRKCQTDGIGGKKVHVTEWQVDKVSWGNQINKWKSITSTEAPTAVSTGETTSKTTLTETTPVVSAETTPVVSSEIVTPSDTSTTEVSTTESVPSTSNTPIDTAKELATLRERLGKMHFQFDGKDIPWLDPSKLEIERTTDGNYKLDGTIRKWPLSLSIMGMFTDNPIIVDSKGNPVNKTITINRSLLRSSIPQKLLSEEGQRIITSLNPGDKYDILTNNWTINLKKQQT